MNFSSLETDFPVGGGGDQPESGLERFIMFELGGRLCCVAAAGVAEVVQPLAVGPLPNSPSWLLGLAAHRGEPVAVIDSAVIARSTPENRGKAKTIVFRARSNETCFALPIDSLREIILAPNREYRSPDYEHNGQPVMFIEHERFFDGFYRGQR